MTDHYDALIERAALIADGSQVTREAAERAAAAMVWPDDTDAARSALVARALAWESRLWR